MKKEIFIAKLEKAIKEKELHRSSCRDLLFELAEKGFCRPCWKVSRAYSDHTNEVIYWLDRLRVPMLSPRTNGWILKNDSPRGGKCGNIIEITFNQENSYAENPSLDFFQTKISRDDFLWALDILNGGGGRFCPTFQLCDKKSSFFKRIVEALKIITGKDDFDFHCDEQWYSMTEEERSEYADFYEEFYDFCVKHNGELIDKTIKFAEEKFRL